MLKIKIVQINFKENRTCYLFSLIKKLIHKKLSQNYKSKSTQDKNTKKKNMQDKCYNSTHKNKRYKSGTLTPKRTNNFLTTL